jgi:hypothetical protein
MRLNRSRRGKTPIDVVIVEQEKGLPRVRLTVGDDLSKPSNKKNSDLDLQEVEDLIVMLTYHKMKIAGDISDNE